MRKAGQIFLLFFFALAGLEGFSQKLRIDTIRIYFDINHSEIKPESFIRLDSVAQIIQKYKKEKLSIIGYADYLGKETHNQDLSDERARNVFAYLLKHGVDSTRIQKCEGKGALEPGIIPLDHHGIQAHRRVDIITGRPVGASTATKTIKTPEKIDVTNLKKNDKIVLHNIYFEPGRHLIRPASYPSIKELVDILKKNRGLKIEIQGYICCDTVSEDGLDEETQKFELSANRARAVYKTLLHYGIDSTRLQYKGYGGKNRLVRVEKSPEDQMMNRRVEIKILETGSPGKTK